MTADAADVDPGVRDKAVGRMVLVAFVAVLGFWLVYPALLDGGGAEDTLPVVVAGELAHRDPAAIYPGEGGFFDLDPSFRTRFCAYYGGSAEDCATHTVPFVSPPAEVPLAVALSWAGDGASTLVRALGVICLVGAMAIIWRTLAVSLEARAAIVLTAALITPLVKLPIDLGQLSPMLFLAVVLPLLGLGRRRMQDLLGAVLGVVIAIKLLPAALLVVPALRGPRRVVVIALGTLAGLSVVSVLIAGATPWHRYLEFSSTLADFARDDPYGANVEKALGELGISSAVASVAVRAFAIGLVALVFRRRDDFGARWAIVWAATMVVAPYVLSHYLFASIGAVAVAVAVDAHARWRVWALPLAAALTLPVALGREATSHTSAILFLTNTALLAVTSVLLLAPSRVATSATADTVAA